MKCEALLQRFLRKLKQKALLTKMNVINCILLVLLLLVSIVFLKWASLPLVIKLVRLFYSIGTLNYDVSRFFRNLLSPVAPDDYSCKDNFYFVSQIKNEILSGKFLVSYDVPRLFTNIPLQETIDRAINLIFNHSSNLSITRKKLFLFSTSQTHFLFNGKLYNQIDEADTGFPLPLVLANIFMFFYEPKWLTWYNLSKRKFYLRYVNDILATFE